MLKEMFKSVIDQDTAPVVLCDMQHTIVYMNPSAKKEYEKYGGVSLLGASLLNCHSKKSCEMIEKCLLWFSEDESHNIIHTMKEPEKNKDIYMVALRNDRGQLIGYYEKHECRTPETTPLYDFS